MRNLGDVYKPLLYAAERLNRTGIPWLVGGSTACVLQGVPYLHKPNDLDIYIDRHSIEDVKRMLDDWEIVPVQTAKTEVYSSYLSRCCVNATEVEFIANMTVRTATGHYKVEVDNLLMIYATEVIVKDMPAPVIPLEHEMVFNLLREREDRFGPIGETLRKKGVNRGLWSALQERNELPLDFWERASALMGLADKGGGS